MQIKVATEHFLVFIAVVASISQTAYEVNVSFQEMLGLSRLNCHKHI